MSDRGPAGADFVQLDLKTTALLFDVDGTLIDIAPRPDAVVVPDDLRQSLARLAKATDGALALVSGRPIADLDRLFAPLVLPAIGGHGAETRETPAQAVETAAPLLEALRRELAAARAIDPGILIEDKGYSLA
ncbi:MAG TPA: trehalose-phosphatase, partial [Pseudolabrys sp.]|nr:trehalose-phosphatase [Pseudolabrys sp.]